MDFAKSIRSVKDYIRLPLVYNHWYVAGLVEEFSNKPKAKTLLERSIVFFRTESGDLTAFQNRCLHRSFPLAEGFLEGDNLVCRYHGIRYAPDGTIARIPCQQQSSKRRLHKYPLKEMGPFVFIWMGDPDKPDMDTLPQLPFLSDPGYRTVYEAVDIKGSYLLMQENLNDLTHFAYLHKDTFRFDDTFFDLPTEVKKVDGGVWCNRVDRHPMRAIAALPPDIQAEAQAQNKPIERWDGGMSVSPGVFKGYAPIYVGEPEAEDRTVYGQHIIHYLTPETKDSTHYFWSMSNDFAIDNDEYYIGLKEHLAKGFAEDKWACDHMQTLLDNDDVDYREMIIAGDQAGLLFRRVMLDWVKAEYSDQGQGSGR
ncbi:MAG: aromatic ring-hydroxylating dioxygenase subunit alpha [Pseudomonadota bacterium]